MTLPESDSVVLPAGAIQPPPSLRAPCQQEDPVHGAIARGRAVLPGFQATGQLLRISGHLWTQARVYFESSPQQLWIMAAEVLGISIRPKLSERLTLSPPLKKRALHDQSIRFFRQRGLPLSARQENAFLRFGSLP
jgi:hypothetical protein